MAGRRGHEPFAVALSAMPGIDPLARFRKKRATSLPPVDRSKTAPIGRTLTIVAPPGKMGVTFRWSQRDGCSVNTVRAGTAMSGKLMPGDRVQSINGTPTHDFTHARMAELITKLVDVERTLVVNRPAVAPVDAPHACAIARRGE